MRPASTLAEILDRSAEAHPDRPALIHAHGRTTYAQLLLQVQRLAALLAGLGVSRGDRVALLLGNCPAFPTLHYALTRLGAVPVPINPSLKGSVLRSILERSGARLLATSPALALALREADEVPGGAIEILQVEGAGTRLQPLRCALGVGAHPRWTDVEDVAPLREPSAAQPEDDAVILFTSGTTGQPKGVVLTHRAALIGLDCWAERWSFDERTISLMVAPFFHVVYHPLVLGAHRRGGAAVVLERLSVRAAFQAAERERATAVMGNPAVFQQFLADEFSRQRDLSAVHTVIYGAAPTPPALVREIQSAFPRARLFNCYGLSETASAVSCLGPEDTLSRPHSIGLPHPPVRLSIRDEAGRDLAATEVGEICVAGPNLMRAYFGDPAATAQRLRDGWLRTGDLGYLDREGFLFILDRTDDLIIVTGEKIYPREVENVLFDHPAVADAVVYGVEHPTRGQVVKALVVLHPGADADEMTLRRYCVERMAAVCVPKVIEFAASLPRNPAGKILRRELR